MSGQKMAGPEYLNAYLNGMQFILMALEGRLQEELDEENLERAQRALYEYHEMAQRMRDRSRLGVRP